MAVLLPTATVRFVGRSRATLGLLRRFCLRTDPSAGPVAPTGQVPLGNGQVGERISHMVLLFRGVCTHVGVVADGSGFSDVRHDCLSAVCRDREWSRPESAVVGRLTRQSNSCASVSGRCQLGLLQSVCHRCARSEPNFAIPQGNSLACALREGSSRMAGSGPELQSTPRFGHCQHGWPPTLPPDQASLPRCRVGRRVEKPGPLQAPASKGLTMADKSPRQSMSKKSDKSLKEKRAVRRAKAAEPSPTDNLLHPKKR